MFVRPWIGSCVRKCSRQILISRRGIFVTFGIRGIGSCVRRCSRRSHRVRIGLVRGFGWVWFVGWFEWHYFTEGYVIVSEVRLFMRALMHSWIRIT